MPSDYDFDTDGFEDDEEEESSSSGGASGDSTPVPEGPAESSSPDSVSSGGASPGGPGDNPFADMSQDKWDQMLQDTSDHDSISGQQDGQWWADMGRRRQFQRLCPVLGG